MDANSYSLVDGENLNLGRCVDTSSLSTSLCKIPSEHQRLMPMTSYIVHDG